MLLVKLPILFPSWVTPRFCSSVGFSLISQTTPLDVTSYPPLLYIIPPEVAEAGVISETSYVFMANSSVIPPSVMVQLLGSPVRISLPSAGAPGEYLLLPPWNGTPLCTSCDAQPISK